MSTTPFSEEFIEKLKDATAWRFSAELKPVFTPRFFCCDDPNDLGISDGKAPVAVLELDPINCLVGDNVLFDGRDSYDPDGSIASYRFVFPSGTPASSVASNGTVTWAAAGEYEVSLVVTDGTGLKSQPARETVTVWEPSGKFYAATSNGVWYTEDGGQNWTAKNSGLSGTSLQVNDVKIDPRTRTEVENKKFLWAATDGGLYFSDNGAGDWEDETPASVINTWGDSPAPDIIDLEWQKVLYWGEYLFAFANWQNAGGDERSFLFRCINAGSAHSGATLIWEQIV